MRIRIVHQLALSLTAAVALSVAAVGGTLVWNLTGGFSDYIKQRDAQRLDRFALYLAERVAAAGSLQALVVDRRRMRTVVDGFMVREAMLPPSRGLPIDPAPGGGVPEMPEPDDLDPVAQGDARNRLRDDFPLRLQLVDESGRRVAGFRVGPTGGPPLLDRPIVVGEKVVGRVRLLPPPGPSGIDAEFLRRQYVGVLLATLGILALTVPLGVWMARRWSRPLQQLRHVTRELAVGRFDVPDPSHRAALEIEQLFDDVTAMAAALKKLELARRQWIAQISHELRSPLSVLRGEIESAEDGARHPSPQWIAHLAAEVAQIGRIVDDLHLLATSDVGALHCERVQVNAWPLLRDIVSRQLREPMLVGLQVQVVEPPAAEITTEWDPGRVEQVISNLVRNSARYTTRPGQVLIAWGRDPRGSDVFFEVQDSAPTVKPQDIAQIFEPLWRGDQVRQRDRSSGEPGGTGLGLAIARAIVTNLGGSIDARASPLGGLAVRFVLPI
jgi:two-component system, OmpR family, sensor histidine kinase BaeS